MSESTTHPDRHLAFDRTARLTGHQALELMAAMPVIIFGVGGVGSWTAEALVRTGFATLTLVDADCVAPTNINRQMPALVSTIGRPKVDVVKERLLDINPSASITTVHGLYTADTASRFNLNDYGYVFDCIDSLSDKALLILNATAAPRTTRFYSSMGAALKMDPTRISTAEFWKVKGCPLAAALRRRFKRTGQFPSRKFTCVYSDELVGQHPLYTPREDNGADGSKSYGKVATNGSLMHITATFGLTLASLAIRDIMSLK
ncbi:MAG: tRNA threonylcarbamoyladenosine dehydratase [Muribaculaceae bacterium]|nr:tRNA threonylcarbamoyladenosine dehydratase [Muribaculaceae bacterium]